MDIHSFWKEVDANWVTKVLGKGLSVRGASFDIAGICKKRIDRINSAVITFTKEDYVMKSKGRHYCCHLLFGIWKKNDHRSVDNVVMSPNMEMQTIIKRGI